MACLSWVPRVKFAPHCAQEKGAIGRFMGGLQNGRSALDHFGGVVDLDCLKCVRPHIRYKQMWVSLAMLGKVGRWRSDMYWRRQFHNRRLSLASEFAGRNLLRNYRYMSANNEQNSYPGGVLVAAAGGYAASVFTWGVFGRGIWHQRSTCYSGGGGSGQPSGGSGGPTSKDDNDKGKPDDGTDRLSAYNRAVIMAHGSKMDEEGVRLAELAALIEYKLGEPLDKAAFSELAQ